MLAQTLDAAAKLAPLVAALAAVFAVVVAAPRELRKWRQVKLDEHRAETAAEALVFSLDLLDGIEQFVVSFGGFSPELLAAMRNEDEATWNGFVSDIRLNLRARRESLEGQLPAFKRIRTRAEVYLDERQRSAIAAVARHVTSVLGAAHMYFWMLDKPSLTDELGRKMLESAFGESSLRSRMEALHEVSAALRPSAQFKEVDGFPRRQFANVRRWLAARRAS